MHIKINVYDFSSILNQNSPFLKEVYKNVTDHRLPFVEHIVNDDICNELKVITSSIIKNQSPKNIVLLGTGGSSLGTRAISSWIGHDLKSRLDNSMPQLYILDNFDPLSWKNIFDKISLKDTFFLIISKSGQTLETLSQAYFLKEWFESHNSVNKLKDHAIVVTEPKNSPLRRYATKYDINIIDHHTKIGGRFSVLSATGLLPILLLGYDADDIVTGAKNAAKFFLNQKYEDNKIFKSASSIALMEKEHKTNAHIGLFYGDRFEGIGLWMRQLLAESLGKNGKGMLFVRAMGPVDQHSQLQLYADGPKDKVYSCYISNGHENHKKLYDNHDPYFSYLQNKSNGDIKDALQFGTLSSLRSHGCKIREVYVPEFNLVNLGELMMTSMIETVIMANIIEVDAFNQPAVEDYKIRTRDLLQA